MDPKTAQPPFRLGDVVICLDDSDGSHFLREGKVYVVDAVRLADSGFRVGLIGMFKMWEAERFRLAK